MKLLVDSDIFCKLGVAGLLDEALAVLGVPVSDCGRLAALPHMLQRGRLVKLYGADACAALLPKAKEMEVVGPAGEVWLEPLVDVPSIDPGEAQLLAVVAQHGMIMLSGDKRALRAVAGVAQVVPALQGKMVTLEAILIELCGRLGVGAVRVAVQPLMASDQTVKICFSSTNSDPEVALASYFSALEREVAPLTLWKPAMEAP